LAESACALEVANPNADSEEKPTKWRLCWGVFHVKNDALLVE